MTLLFKYHNAFFLINANAVSHGKSGTPVESH